MRWTSTSFAPTPPRLKAAASENRGVLIGLTELPKNVRPIASAFLAVDAQKPRVVVTEGLGNFRRQASVWRNFNGSPVHGRPGKDSFIENAN